MIRHEHSHPNHSSPGPHQPRSFTTGDAPMAEEFGLLDVWGILVRRRWLILFGLVVGLALATVYLLRTEPTFESTVQILVIQNEQPLTGGDQGAQVARPLDEDVLSNHMQLFMSHNNILGALDYIEEGTRAQIAEELGGEATDAELAAALKRRLAESLPTIEEARSEDKDVIKHVLDNLEVTRGGEGKAKGASVLNATYSSTSADEAAIVLDALVHTYQDFWASTYSNTSDEAVALLIEDKDRQAAELAKLEKEYEEFLAGAPPIWRGDDTVNVYQDLQAQVEQDLNKLEGELATKSSASKLIEDALKSFDAGELGPNDLWAYLSREDIEAFDIILRATTVSPDEDPDRDTDRVILVEKMRVWGEQLLELRQRREQLLRDFAQDHPDVATIDKQIRLTEEMLAENNTLTMGTMSGADEQEEFERPDPVKTVKNQLRKLNNEIASLRSKEEQLQAKAADAKKKAHELGAVEAEGLRRRGQIERLQKDFDTAVQQLRELNIQSQVNPMLPEVITPIAKADKAAWPKLPIVMALGVIAGFMLGAGLAYLRELTDRTFRHPEELGRVLNAPVLGHIPKIAVNRVKRAKDSTISSSIIVQHDPSCVDAEVFRGLRTALYFGAGIDQHSVIQVTSANPGDGKTTIAANLAVAIAQSGRRVLLIDGDLRNPNVHKTFGLKVRPGLSNLLVDETQELSDLVVEVGVSHLHVLTAGTRRANPSESLTSPRFVEFLDMVRERYDCVIIDSPPVLPVSDPCVIASHVDGVLLTVKINKNGKPQAVRARHMLTEVGVNLIGLVVNGYKIDRNYGVGHYGDQYGYGSYGFDSSYGTKYSYGKKYGYGDGGDDEIEIEVEETVAEAKGKS